MTFENKRPVTRDQAEAAVRTLLQWAGDNPDREGLLETPDRVVRAYEEFFAGYDDNPTSILQSASFHAEGYGDMVILRNIRFESHCEHHIIPILGKIHLAYIPHHRVVGISKLARVCDVFAKRLQIQESMTNGIAHAIDQALGPIGVAVYVEGAHQCMTTRGVHKTSMDMVTRCFLGSFAKDRDLRREFLDIVLSTRS
ncbi:MAG: GTP cyclohydrolase I FolE [Alphaproteobacteria bacterium]